MSEHRIRLRGAWDRIDRGDPVPRRVTLPTVWDATDRDHPFTLRRAFGGPAVDLTRQTICLELGDIPGLVAVRLNGVVVAEPGVATKVIRLDLGGDLLPRNVLELDVKGVADPARDYDHPWGAVALVIDDRPL